jgi:hypothetical protein
MFCLVAEVVCRYVSSTDLFLWRSSWSCIDAVRVLFLLICVPCIWEKCCVFYVVDVNYNSIRRFVWVFSWSLNVRDEQEIESE